MHVKINDVWVHSYHITPLCDVLIGLVYVCTCQTSNVCTYLCAVPTFLEEGWKCAGDQTTETEAG